MKAPLLALALLFAGGLVTLSFPFSHAWAQGSIYDDPLLADPGKRPKKKTKKPTYYPSTAKLNEARQEFSWASLYYDSYAKTQEPKYIEVSSEHLKGAIRGYYDLQQSIDSTNPHYHTARRERMEACGFYQLLRQRALDWQGAVTVPSLKALYCVDQ